MGLKEEELQPLVTAWRNSNHNIVKFWWAVDHAVMKAITERTTAETHGLAFTCRSGMLFITLPSGRKLACEKPRIGMNQFGGESVTYEGVGTAPKGGNASRATAPNSWRRSSRPSQETFSAMPCRPYGIAAS